jgi:uncharacterized protein with GYD domain
VPKYLIQASYTPEGLQGLARDSASGRRADVQSAVKELGGKVEAFYYAFGADDVIIILDLPDIVTAAAVALTTASSGAVFAPRLCSQSRTSTRRSKSKCSTAPREHSLTHWGAPLSPILCKPAAGRRS